jgi:RNA polymerase sigma-32 factor
MKPHEHSRQCTESIEQAARTAPLLSGEEEQRLARMAQRGDERAFEQLIRAHLRLVFATAWEFRSYGLPGEELLSEGLLGLVKGVRGYDPERGVRLASYASLWIRAYMRRCTLEGRRVVRLPSSRAGRRVLAGLRRTERRLEHATGRTPDVEAIADALGVTAADVDEMRAALGSHDIPYDVEIAGRRFDIASDAPSPEAVALEVEGKRISRELLRQALSQLTPRARRVIEQRCLSDDVNTLADLSQELGISRERVRQIEAHAKTQLRAAITPFADTYGAATLPMA